MLKLSGPSRPYITYNMFFLFHLDLLSFTLCREISIISNHRLFVYILFWTPLQQTAPPFNQQCVSVMLVMFTVFIARVYADGFLLCYGSVPNCLTIGPDDQRWLTITAETESWFTCLPQSQWAGVLQCLCQTFLFLKGVYALKLGWTCPSMGIFPPPDHYCIWDSVIRGPGSYSRWELSHRRGLQGDLLGDKPDHCTERAFVWVCPTHVLLGPFLSPLTSLSLPWPVGAGRLNVMTPFSLRALWGPSIPLTFTQLSLRCQGYPHQLWSPTPAQKTHRNTHRELLC